MIACVQQSGRKAYSYCRACMKAGYVYYGKATHSQLVRMYYVCKLTDQEAIMCVST